MSAAPKPRHALVVAYCFPPHAAIGTMRTLRVVQQLADRGWHVTVLTSDPTTYLPGTPVDAALLARVPQGVRVLRAPVFRPWARLERALRAFVPARTIAVSEARAAQHAGVSMGSRRSRWLRPLAKFKDAVDALLSIPDREVGWILPAVLHGIFAMLRKHRPDVIYASAPPWSGQIVAALLKAVLRRPWVADFRDPWARAPWRDARLGFVKRAAAALERYAVGRADRVIFVTTTNRAEFAIYYGEPLAEKFDVVPNGCDPREFESLHPAPAPATDPFVLLHAGSLYAGRTPLPVLRGLSAAIARGVIDGNRFRLRFLGTNALQDQEILDSIRELGLNEVVEFLPRVSREESLRAMMSASALLLLQPGHTVSVPGKVYEYLATGRLILAIAEEGDLSALVRDSGAGFLVSPEDEQGIVNALAMLVRDARSQRPALARELFDGNLRAVQVAAALETLVDDLSALKTMSRAGVLP